MIVLIEGPDCSGKSTIADKFINKDFYYTHIHKYPDINAAYQQKVEQLKALRQAGIDVVIDRLFWSNTIYSQVFGDSVVLDDSIRNQLNELIDVVIFCVPEDKQKYIEKFNAVKQTRFEDYNEMGDIYDKFHNLVNNPATKQYHKNQRIFTYDMFQCSIEDVDMFVNNLLARVH